MAIFKRSISLLLVLCMVLGFIPAAYAIDGPEPVIYGTDEAIPTDGGPCGAEGADVTWTLYDDGELVISGTGAMADYVSDSSNSYTSSSPFYAMRDQIKSVTVEEGVTHVGDYAFYLCSEITSLKTAASVKTIGRFAFGGSKWEDPMKLSSLSLAEGLEVIGVGAFTDCYALGSVTIPDSVTVIDAQAFYQCTGLAEVKFGKGLTHIYDLAFMYCEGLNEVIIPDSVTYVGEWAFYGCSSAMELVIGKGVQTLGEQVFCQMSRLTSVTIPGNIKTLPFGAFYECSRLTEVTFEEGLQTIGASCFYRCGWLESVVLPATLSRIEERAFMNCSSLAFATFTGKAPTVDITYLFYKCASDFKIYYPSHLADSGWSTPEWNGYPAYPYDVKGTLPETWPVNNGAHVITVVNRDAEPIVGATVKIFTGGSNIESLTTDENGQVAYYSNQGLEVRIEADGYQIRRSAYVMKTGESRLFVLDPLPADGAPYFTMLSAYARVNGGLRRVDLLTDAVHYTMGDGTGMKLLLEVAVDEDRINLQSVSLYQNPVGFEQDSIWMTFMHTGKQPEFRIEDGSFLSNPYQIAPGQFRAGQTVYAIIEYKIKGGDGTTFHTEPIPLSLIIDPAPTATPTESNGINTSLTPGTAASGDVSWLESIPLPADNVLFSAFLNANPSITSELLGFTYSIVEEEPGERKLRIAIGLTGGEKTVNMLTGKTEEDVKAYETFRNQILDSKNTKGEALGFAKTEIGKTLKEEFKTTSVKSVLKMDGEIIGYLEVPLDDATGMPKYDSGGKILNADGKVLVNISGEFVGGNTILLSGFPLYFEYKAGAGLATTLKLNLESAVQSAGLVLKPRLEEVALTIPKLSLESGVGIRGVATVGIGGTFENTITNTLSEVGEVTSKIVGTTNAYFRVYVAFLVDYTKEFRSQDGGKAVLYTYPEGADSSSLSYSTGQTISQQALAEPALQLSDRAYLAEASRWNGNPIRLFSDGGLATLQNGVLPNAMPELIDLGGRQLLLFLADDGTRALGSHTRLMYSVRENGAWSVPAPVWNTATGDQYFDCALVDGQLYVAWQKLRGPVTGEDTDAMLASLAEQSEIALARWDVAAGAFTGQQYLTGNDTLDMMVSLCGEDGKLHVTWVSNSENDLMGASGENAVKTLTYRDGAAEPETLYTTDRFLTEVVTAADKDGLHVLVGALDEENRTDLLHLTGGEAYTVMEGGAFAGLSAENGRFLWQNDGVLYRYSPEIRQYEAMVTLPEGGVSSSYRYVTNGRTEAVVWSQGQEPAQILASVRGQGVWQTPVVLADNIDRSVNFLDAALTADGSFLLVANTADYSGISDAATALETALIEPIADVAVTNVRVETPTPGGYDRELFITVKNLGSGTVAQEYLQVTLTDETGAILLDRPVMVYLTPGDTGEFYCPISLAGFTDARACTLTVLPARDSDPGNNSHTFSLGHTDAALSLDVQEVGDQVFCLLTGSNGSAIPADARIRVHQGSLDTPELAVLELGTLVYGESVQSLYILDKTAVDFGGEDRAHFLFALETDQADASDRDDLQVYTLRRPEEVPAPGLGDREQIVTVLPESMEILNGDVSFSGPDAAPVKLEVQILPADSSFTQPSWSVDDDNVAAVMPDGTLYPVAAGTTTVTATLGEELSAAVTVTVGQPADAHVHTPALMLGYGPTCTEEGCSDGVVCAGCGEMLIPQTFTTPLGHDHVWHVEKDAGCEDEGLRRGECSRCGDTLEETLAPVGHDWSGTRCLRCGEARPNPFTDVPDGSFYIDAVLWAVEKGITNGTSATAFSPNDSCMRAHVVTFLWRAAGSPAPTSGHNPFVDVKPADFYYEAVLWAVEQGITNGLDATHFGPTSYCNRAQVVTFLHRALGNPVPMSQNSPFADVPAGSFYYTPVLWAVENQVTNGLDATHFGPDAICNRAQIVTFLYRAFN